MTESILEVVQRLFFAEFGLFDDGASAVLAVRLVALSYVVLSSISLICAVARFRDP